MRFKNKRTKRKEKIKESLKKEKKKKKKKPGIGVRKVIKREVITR